MAGIGELNEKPLHAALKAACAEPGDRFEVPVDGYVIDIVRDDLLVEIQSRNFSAIKVKLKNLLHDHRLRLVYPIAGEKWIVKLPRENGDSATRRKSPKKGRLEDLFWELIRIPHLMAHPNFSLEILLVQEEEVWRYEGQKKRNGRRHWRKKGWVTEERRLLEIVDRRLLASPADAAAFLPDSLGETFTTKDIAEGLKIRRALAQRMAYCLRHMQAVELIGKQSRANLYARFEGDSA